MSPSPFTRRRHATPAHAFFLSASLPEPARSSDTAVTGLHIELGRRGWTSLTDGYSYVLPVVDGPGDVEPAGGLTAESIAEDLAAILPNGTRYTVCSAIHGQPPHSAGERLAPTGEHCGRGPEDLEPGPAEGFAAQVTPIAHIPPTERAA